MLLPTDKLYKPNPSVIIIDNCLHAKQHDNIQVQSVNI